MHGGEQRWLLRQLTLLRAMGVYPVLAIEIGLALTLTGLPVRGRDAWTVARSTTTARNFVRERVAVTGMKARDDKTGIAEASG